MMTNRPPAFLGLKVGILVAARFAGLWWALVVGGLLDARDVGTVGVNLLVVASLEAALVTFVVLRSRWTGRPLWLVVFSMLLPLALLPRLLTPGLIVSALLSPVVVVVLGKMGTHSADDTPNPRLALTWGEWAWKLAAVVGAYVVLHSILGCAVTLASPSVRLYHAIVSEASFSSQLVTSLQVSLGSAAFDSYHLVGWTGLALTELVRASIYVIWALPLVRMVIGPWWVTAAVTSFLYAVPGNLDLLLPDPYVLRALRLPLLLHEVSTGLLLGGVLVWLLHRHHVSGRDLFQWKESGQPRRYLPSVQVRDVAKRCRAMLGSNACQALIGTFGCTSVLVAIPCACLVALFVGPLFCFPSTQTQARRYLHAVANENAGAAAALAPEADWCSETMAQDARRDVRQFGGSQLRKVEILTYYSTGSDESIECGWIHFEYRQVGQDLWQKGEIRLMTDHPSFGFCYICSRLSG
jgi:hypothetical protein